MRIYVKKGLKLPRTPFNQSINQSINQDQTVGSEELSDPYLFFNPAPKQDLAFTCLQYKSFVNTVGKAATAHNEQFLLSQQYFSTLLMTVSPLSANLKLSFGKSFSSEKSKISHLGKGKGKAQKLNSEQVKS